MRLRSLRTAKPGPKASPMTSWIILRCSGRSTLPLARSLQADGYDVWTPSEMKRNRRPRKNAGEPEPAPIMPTFVFARSVHVVDLLELAEMPVKPRRGKGLHEPAHDDFSVFHFNDRIPLVRDAALAPLRREEELANIRQRRELAKGKSDPFEEGQVIRIPEGAFSGLSGHVVESNGKFTLLCFGRMEVEFSTFILRSDVANRLQAATTLAA